MPDRPSFPTGTTPTKSSVADWVEAVVLITGKAFKRGDLKTAVSIEGIDNPDALEQQTWKELVDRATIFEGDWALELDGQRLRPRMTPSPAATFYQYMCLIALSSPSAEDEKLFELVVTDVVSDVVSPGSALHIGAPASPGMDPSFRQRVVQYSTASNLHSLEIGAPPLSHDKDLGVDVVAWWSLDKRGGGLHFLFQCAAGADWPSKLSDSRLERWKYHLMWANAPVRLFCVPRILSMSPEKWMTTTALAGVLLDRHRLARLASDHALAARLSAIEARVEELVAA